MEGEFRSCTSVPRVYYVYTCVGSGVWREDLDPVLVGLECVCTGSGEENLNKLDLVKTTKAFYLELIFFDWRLLIAFFA